MDCCEPKHEKHTEHEKETVSLKKNTMMWIVIGVLVLAAAYLMFKSPSGAPAQAAASAAGGMVGGC